MKLILLLFTISNFGVLYAQKRYKKTDHNSAFPYSYQCFGYNYRPDGELYTLAILDHTSDSLIVWGSFADSTTSGIASYEYSSEYFSAPVKNGAFELFFLKNDRHDVLSLNLFLNGYDDASCTVGLYLEEEMVFSYIYKKTIFNPETPYVIVYSSKSLTSAELRELLVCLPPEHGAENTCFDPKKIQIQYPK
jgi:hypothetical protein